MAKRCYLKSRANYPVIVQYDGKTMVIPPNGKIELGDTRKVGVLPPKVRKIEIEGDV